MMQQWLLFMAGLTRVASITFPFPLNLTSKPFIPEDFCILPPDYGSQGTTTYLEECDSLNQFVSVPKPGESTQAFGTHSLVCCPKKIYKEDFICFPTDAWCPTYKKQEMPEPDKDVKLIAPLPITMANRTCYNTPLPPQIFGGKILSQCVPINQCAQLLDYPNAPVTVTQPCGFDEEESNLMICCPQEFVKPTPEKIHPEPRFPVDNDAGGEPRKCTDKTDMCAVWKKNGGCRLDRSFSISGDMFRFDSCRLGCPVFHQSSQIFLEIIFPSL